MLFLCSTAKHPPFPVLKRYGKSFWGSGALSPGPGCGLCSCTHWVTLWFCWRSPQLVSVRAYLFSRCWDVLTWCKPSSLPGAIRSVWEGALLSGTFAVPGVSSKCSCVWYGAGSACPHQSSVWPQEAACLQRGVRMFWRAVFPVPGGLGHLNCLVAGQPG